MIAFIHVYNGEKGSFDEIKGVYRENPEFLLLQTHENVFPTNDLGELIDDVVWAVFYASPEGLPVLVGMYGDREKAYSYSEQYGSSRNTHTFVNSYKLQNPPPPPNHSIFYIDSYENLPS